MALDHGGGLDAAIAQFGGTRAGWLDLSTGINPVPYPVPEFPHDAWTALPDITAQNALISAARALWNVPEGADIIAAPGASALIARIPYLIDRGTVEITKPTYNEHLAAFLAAHWQEGKGNVQVVVHPNNPDGRLWTPQDLTAPLRVIDESFCDVTPDASLIAEAAKPGTLILKSFGKFWGLAGARLGFLIGDPNLIATMRDMLGPWPVSGPVLSLGAQALSDTTWANAARRRLTQDSQTLDDFLSAKGATPLGGTTLFRLYQVDDAQAWQSRLAQGHVWSRIFPYSSTWLRLGLPAPDRWDHLRAAL